MISNAEWRRILNRFGHRCAYCQMMAKFLPQGLEKDHIIPRKAGGSDRAQNICPACPSCNAHKARKILGLDPETGVKIRLFNPYRQNWREHFRWDDSGAVIIGKTAIGRATAATLQMNTSTLIAWRKIFVDIGDYPPQL